MLLLAAAYVATAKLGLSMDPVGGFATLVWPPTGLAMAALRLHGCRIAPGVLLGASLVNAWTGAPPLVALGIGVGNTLEALSGAYLLRCLGGAALDFDRVRHVLALLLAAAPTVAAISATVGILTLLGGGVVTQEIAAHMWHVWWLGDLASALLVYPLIVSWAHPRPSDRARPRRRIETASLLATLSLTGLLLFALPKQLYGPIVPLQKLHILFPLLIWTALRFGPRVRSAVPLLIAGAAIVGTLLGRGVFAGDAPQEALMVAQVFLGTAAGTVAILGAATAERNRAEDALRRARASLEVMVEQRTTELQSLLAQKNVLLQEVHHRVKNNLQVVSSVLHMQSSQMQDPSLRAALHESEGRVRAIALVHETLYETPDLASIGVRRYIESLGAGVVRAASGPTELTLDVDAEDLMLGIDAAIPCGLIVNELICNALKHAFPGRARGRITVGVHANEALTLDVADDGVGIPPAVDFRNTPTLGLRLVCSLTQQLGGTIELDRSHGTSFRIRLPRELARSR